MSDARHPKIISHSLQPEVSCPRIADFTSKNLERAVATMWEVYARTALSQLLPLKTL
jgi:hypothetical protein